MLHITNGTCVEIDRTGLPGRVIYWVDPLHDGPVPAGLPLQDLSRIRERFLSEFFGTPLDQVSLGARDQALAEFGDHAEVVLWFEHDLYDQLQLIQILDWFSTQDRGNTRLSLICTDTYLGPLRAEQLLPMFETRHPVSSGELHLGQRAWAAFRAAEPGALGDLLRSDTSALPYLEGALRRHLEQFPSSRNGLSRSERQALTLIESGVHEFGALFQKSQALEERIYLGDLTFRRYLLGLAGGRHPLLRAEGERFEETPMGHLVLEGREDHVRRNGINRWLGGVHLCEGAPVWRWDETRQAITI